LAGKFSAILPGAERGGALGSGELKWSSRAGALPYFLIQKREGEPGGSPFTRFGFFAVRLHLDAASSTHRVRGVV